MMSALTLVRHYGEGEQLVQALHPLDLQIARNDFVAIMGSSGSGKWRHHNNKWSLRWSPAAR